MKSILSKLSGLMHIFRYGDRLHPARDWFILLGLAALVLIASFTWHALLFVHVTNGEAIGTATSTASLNPTSIDSVTTLFEKRAQAETMYKNGHFVDPSS
jgi:hypothetical protein